MEEIIEIPEGETVVEELTRTLFINPQGHLLVGWTREFKGEKKFGWTEIDDIDTTMWQQLHIVGGYLILLGERSAWLPGELVRVKDITRRTLSVANSYLADSESITLEAGDIQSQVRQVVQLIGRVTNPHKERAQLRMKIVGATLKTSPAGRIEQAGMVIEAAGDMTKRASQILEICKGVLIRLEMLNKKRQNCVGILTGIYRGLEEIRKQDESKPMEEWSEQKIAWLKRGFNPEKTSLIAGLPSVNVEPYRSRAALREIDRLKKIPKYLDKKDFGSVRRAFSGAMMRLERVMAEVSKSFSPLAIGKEMKRRVEQ